VGLYEQQVEMQITVIFSSLFRALAGTERDILDVAEGTTITSLANILTQKYQDIPIESKNTYFIVNDQPATLDQVLAKGDKVRIFQLLAGG
jgi:molybdopterin converting factor small subunit